MFFNARASWFGGDSEVLWTCEDADRHEHRTCVSSAATGHQVVLRSFYP
jgi:hypothetical protein